MDLLEDPPWKRRRINHGGSSRCLLLLTQITFKMRLLHPRYRGFSSIEGFSSNDITLGDTSLSCKERVVCCILSKTKFLPKNYIFKGCFHTQDAPQRETLRYLEISYVVILRNPVRSSSVACSEQKLISFTKTWRITCISPFSGCPEVAVLCQHPYLTQPSECTAGLEELTQGPWSIQENLWSTVLVSRGAAGMSGCSIHEKKRNLLVEPCSPAAVERS